MSIAPLHIDGYDIDEEFSQFSPYEQSYIYPDFNEPTYESDISMQPHEFSSEYVDQQYLLPTVPLRQLSQPCDPFLPIPINDGVKSIQPMRPTPLVEFHYVKNEPETTSARTQFLHKRRRCDEENDATTSGSGASSPISLPCLSPTPTSDLSMSSPVSTSDDNDDHGEDCDNLSSSLSSNELRRRRLNRKAELARLSRKRKRTRLEDLTIQVKHLQQELDRAKRSNATSEAKLAANYSTLGSNGGDQNNYNFDRLFNAIVAWTPSEGEDNLSRMCESLAITLEQQTQHATSLIQQLQLVVQPIALIEQMTSSMVHCSTLEACIEQHFPNVGAESASELNALRTTLSKQHRFDGDVSKIVKRLDTSMSKLLKQRWNNLERIRAALSPVQIQNFLSTK